MTRKLTRLPRTALIVCAWLFLIASAVGLGFSIVQLRLTDDPIHFGIVTGDTTNPGGLTFAGDHGLALATATLLALLLAIAATLQSRRRPRILGHLGLITWATFWLVKALVSIAMTGLTCGWLLGLYALFWLATFVRAWPSLAARRQTRSTS